MLEADVIMGLLSVSWPARFKNEQLIHKIIRAKLQAVVKQTKDWRQRV